MNNSTTLSIVIVNYKIPELLRSCIGSIYNDALEPLYSEIIVVDNDSQDESRSIIINTYPQVEWIQNQSNEGFGRANNIGIIAAKGEFVLLLNSDVIASFDNIELCLNELQNRPDKGVLGCKLINEDRSLQKSTYSVASFRKMLDQNLIINKLWPMGNEPIEAVMGSFMLIPRKVFLEVGGFDPDFFMYSEELELCHRISQKGYSIEYFEGATATHINGGSTTNKEWSMKQRYLSEALLFLKVRGDSGYFLYHFLFLFNAICNLVFMWFIDQNWRRSYFKELKYYFSNFGHYFLIPFLYSKKPGNGKRMLKRNS